MHLCAVVTIFSPIPNFFMKKQTHHTPQSNKDQDYLDEWDKFWNALTPAERHTYKEKGIHGPLITKYTTRRPDFNIDQIDSTAAIRPGTRTRVLQPELEKIWKSKNVPLSIVTALADLGNALYKEYKTKREPYPYDVAKPLRIVLDIIQSESSPGLALAIILKWLQSDLARMSDRELAKMFGVTFQNVSLTRDRLSEKLNCELYAGKSPKAKESYRLCNKKKD